MSSSPSPEKSFFAPFVVDTHNPNPARLSLSEYPNSQSHPHSNSHHRAHLPSTSNSSRPSNHHPSTSLSTVNVDADSPSTTNTGPIPPTTFPDLPPAQKKLIRRHKKLHWALLAGFQFSLILFTVSIVLTATESHSPTGKVIWHTVVLGIVGFAGVVGCALCGWDVWKGQKERERLQARWGEVEGEREARKRREESRWRYIVDEIRSRRRNRGPIGGRRPSHGRSTERDEVTPAQDERQEMTNILYNNSDTSTSPSRTTNQPFLPDPHSFALPLGSLRPTTPTHTLPSSSLKTTTTHQICPLALRHPAFDPPASLSRQ